MPREVKKVKCYNGNELTISELSKLSGVNRNTIRERIKNKRSMEEVLSAAHLSPGKWRRKSGS